MKIEKNAKDLMTPIERKKAIQNGERADRVMAMPESLKKAWRESRRISIKCLIHLILPVPGCSLLHSAP